MTLTLDGGQVLERPAEAKTSAVQVQECACWACYWQAMSLIDRHFALGGGSILKIPPLWIAQQLMDKAGVPRDFIARAFQVESRQLNSRLAVLTALMVFAPYGAQIEALMREMPEFEGMQRDYGALEEPCAVAG